MTQGPSLRDFDRPADRIRLHRQARFAPVIVVEGRTDKRLHERVLPFEVDIFVAGTRQEVLEAAAQLSAHRLRAAVGVVDRDFDDAVGLAIASGLPVVAYDGADVEAMLFMSSALAHLLAELASSQKLAAAGGHEGIRDRVVSTLRPVSTLRRFNALHGWGLAFDAVDLAGKMKVQNPRLEPRSLIDALLRASDYATVGRVELEAGVASDDDLTCPESELPLFRGRDALAVLGVLLRREVGGCKHQQCQSEHLASVLRLAVDPGDLLGVPWYARLTSALGLSA